MKTRFTQYIVYFSFLQLLFSIQTARAQNWSALGGGLDNWVHAVAVYNGDLIVGGQFTNAGGVPANYIARWNGIAWDSLGSGMDGEVDALCVYNGELIAGGRFLNAGGVSVNYIARWDGLAWTDVSGGTNSYVSALTVYNNKLIAGGYFTDAEALATNYIGQWDNSGWSKLGTGMGGSQGQVLALTVYNNQLVAAGFFTTAGGIAASHIAAWSGTTWDSLSSGIAWITYALTTYNGNLVAGGLFSNAGGVSASDVAMWNGSSWSALGSGVGGGTYGYVFALTTLGSDLFAGGIYTTAGGQPAANIAKWNGSSWIPAATYMGSGGTVQAVYALCDYDSGVVAGGIFNNIDGVGGNNVAKYRAAAGCNMAIPVITPQSATSFCPGDSVILIASSSAPAGTTSPDQSQLVYNAGTSARTLAGYSEWQSFTAGITGTLSRLDIGFFNAINGSGTLNIFSGAGAGGTLLQTQTVNVVCPSGNCMLPFNVSVPVTAGQAYTFQFIPGAGMPDPYGLQVDAPGAYAGGQMAIVDPSGTSYPGFDMVFQTYVTTGVNLSYSWSNGTLDSTTKVYSSNTYTVTVSDTSGCSASAAISVHVFSVNVPVITQVVDTLQCSTASTYQWYLGANAINGATHRTFTPLQNGIYTVAVTDSNGCAAVSADYNFIATAINESGFGKIITAIPNPSYGKFLISVPAEKLQLQVTNAIGQVIEVRTVENKTSIPLEIAVAGFYFLRISNGEWTVTQRLIVKK